MKINQIVQETTTSGSVAPVEHGFVKMQTRSPSVYGNTKAGSLFKGKKTKAPYANSINEGAEISEAELQEDDIIVIPGQGRKLKSGFVPHGQSRVDHEVEMARSDVLATMKNAKAIYELLKNRSEDEGLEGWVQEKLIKANDYLNAVKEYYDEKLMQQESVPPAGVIGNGSMGESHSEVKDKEGKVVSWKDDTEWHKAEKNKKGQPKDPRGVVTHLSDIARRKTEKQITHEGVRVDSLVTDALKLMRGPELTDAVQALKTVLGDREFSSRRGHYNFYIRQMLDMYSKQGVKEGAKVDRMVKHIEKSEKKLGRSSKEAENIAWATANKRGMLDNKNKKK